MILGVNTQLNVQSEIDGLKYQIPYDCSPKYVMAAEPQDTMMEGNDEMFRARCHFFLDSTHDYD
jgi:hypothetical protein